MVVWSRGWYGDDWRPARTAESISLFCRVLSIWRRLSTRREENTVPRSQVKTVVVAVMMLSASMTLYAAPKAPFAGTSGAVVSGIVRDAQGVAQMGALVQIVASDSLVAASAFTDLHGRYVLANVLPGKYYVRASAALFVPALRENLQLRSGVKTVVNLTLSTLFETASWLPAERRKADEPGDDWKWTLRSGANRPILRMVEDGEIVLISSSAAEKPNGPIDSAKGSVVGGDGTFGGGGVHHTISLDRGIDTASDVRFRVDVGSGLAPGHTSMEGRPSTELQTGYQRKLGPGGAARTVVSYQSHPEMMGTGRFTGLDAVQIATAQKMQLGDLAEVEAGSSLSMVHTSGYLTTARPFLRITAHPTSTWSVGYRMATSRDMQSYNALDDIQPALPVAIMSQGKLRTERGIHQEVSLTRKAGRGVLQASYYRDALDNVLVSGGGGLNAADLDTSNASALSSAGVIADTTTGGFKLLASGYRTQGISVILTEPLSSGLWAAVEYASGSALTTEGVTTLTNVGTTLKTRSAQSATIAVKGRVLRSGTSMRAAYRWQPAYLVTAVDPYTAFSDQAYLSFFVRQPINCGHWLPAGLQATVDVTNLLAQGYRPFLSADGRTLFLAQAPRSIQAGLAFTF